MKQLTILFDDAFSHFWGPIFDSSNVDMYQKVEMIDPMGKKIMKCSLRDFTQEGYLLDMDYHKW